MLTINGKTFADRDPIPADALTLPLAARGSDAAIDRSMIVTELTDATVEALTEQWRRLAALSDVSGGARTAEQLERFYEPRKGYSRMAVVEWHGEFEPSALDLGGQRLTLVNPEDLEDYELAAFPSLGGHVGSGDILNQADQRVGAREFLTRPLPGIGIMVVALFKEPSPETA